MLLPDGVSTVGATADAVSVRAARPVDCATKGRIAQCAVGTIAPRTGVTIGLEFLGCPVYKPDTIAHWTGRGDGRAGAIRGYSASAAWIAVLAAAPVVLGSPPWQTSTGAKMEAEIAKPWSLRTGYGYREASRALAADVADGAAHTTVSLEKLTLEQVRDELLAIRESLLA